jgi:rubrerythrin
MDLGTFGAILGFGMELEEQTASFYEGGAKGSLEEGFATLARGSRKRLKRLERNRREGVAEMILEPITGLDGDSYQVSLDPQADEAELLRQAKALEENAVRFYRDSAAKMPVRDVSRALARMAEDSEKRLAELKQMG